MKKKMKIFVAFLLTFLMMFSLCTNAFASETPFISNLQSTEYYESDGTYVEKVTFLEKGINAAVIKRTYTDGTFDVEAINGKNSIYFEGKVKADSSTISGYSSKAVTYPYYTDYWYAGTDKYSMNGTAITVAAIAGAITAATGLGASAAATIASAVYTALGTNIYQNIYFETKRYYATLENGPGLPTVWYNKFVTTTYSDKYITKVGKTVTEVFESSSPM